MSCTTQTQTSSTIRNEGKTEQIADYVFGCTNTGTATATANVSVTIQNSVPVTSKVLNTGNGLTEAALIVQDSTGQQLTQTYLGTVSGSTVSFSNVPIPESSNIGGFQPFTLTITNIRVDATFSTAGATIGEAVSIGGTLINTANFPVSQMAQVQSGLSAQSTSDVVNFPVCKTVSAAGQAFNVKFGENSAVPAAFKAQGGSGNTTPGSWATNNTESGYFIPSAVSGQQTNTASSGTRLRILFSNVPANLTLYVPLTVASSQTITVGVPAGSVRLTATEAGAFSPVGASANPSGYTGTSQLAQLTVTNGSAEAVYEVIGDTASVAESYQVPVYLGTSGTIAAQTAPITAAVSFAPVGAASNIPNFSQLASTTAVAESLFPVCLAISTSTLPAGTIGQAYGPLALSATGGAGTYTWSGTGLPAGMTVTSAGQLQGTPTATGVFSSVILAVTDTGSNQTASQTYSLTIAYPTLTIATSGALGTIPLGGSLPVSFSATGGNPPYTWSSQGTLAPGLSLSSSGNLSGTVTQAGNYSFTVKVTDAQPVNTSVTVTLSVMGITTSSLPAATANVAYSTTVTAAGGTAPYTYTGSAFPSGFSISSAGVVTGISSVVKSTLVQVNVTDSASVTSTSLFTLTVNPQPVSVTTTTLPNGTSESAYSQTLSATGGTPPYTWSIPTGAANFANAGLVLNASTGAITGVPDTSGLLSFTVQATDSAQGSATMPLTLQINPAVSATYDFAVVNSGSNIVRVAADGSRTSTICSGASCHPSDITADSLGVIYAKDSTGIAKITPAGAVTQLVSFSGGTGTFGNGGGQGGIALDGLGNIVFVDNKFDAVYRVKTDGTGLVQVAPFPVQSASQPQDAYIAIDRSGNYIVASDDSGGQTTIYSFTPAGVATTIATNPATGSRVGGLVVDISGNYEYVESASGSIVKVSPSGSIVTIAAGSTTCCGPGLTLESSTNLLVAASGLRTAANLERITNAGTTNGAAVTSILSGAPLTAPVSIAPIPLLMTSPLTVTPTSLASGIMGQSYGPFTVSASGGTGNYTWSATGLPAGITVSAAGIVSGTPTGSGSFSAQITATDTLTAQTGSATITIAIGAGLTISGGTTSFGTVALGRQINTSYTAGGGVGPYSWSSAGTLAPGLTLTAAGVLSGTVTQPGNYSFTVQVTDAEPVTVPATVTISVLGIMTASPLPAATATVAYSATVNAAGGTGPYSFTATGLPTGLSISNGGVIAGTTTVTGPATVSITVADSNRVTSTSQFALTVLPPPVSVTTSALPNGEVGVAYSQSAAASGGTQPYTWTVTAGALPGGLTLSTGGLIAGTATQSGPFSFTLKVTDANGSTATAMLSITVASGPSVTTTSLPGGVAGESYGPVTLGVTGGAQPYTWSVAAGALPPGLTLSTGGSIGGTPTQSGPFSFTVKATDTNGGSATAMLSIAVANAVSVTTTSLPGGIVGQSYGPVTVAANGGVQPYTWSVTAGALPGGLTLSSGGSIGGTPTQNGPFSFTVKVTDMNGGSATAMLSISVASAVSITTTSLPGGTIGQPYGPVTVAAAAGSGTYSWSATGLPTGLSIGASTGSVSGTPGAGGPFSAKVTVTDTVTHQTASQTYSISISYAPLTIMTSGTLGTIPLNGQFSTTFAAAGGKPSYTWSSQGTLPPGLSLSAAGALTGVPAQTGNYSFTVQVTDAQPVTTPVTVTMSVMGITTSSLPAATASTSYSATVIAAGGTGPYTFTGSGFPAGLSISTAGIIGGTTGVSGPAMLSITVTDASRVSSTSQLSLTVNPSPVTVSATALSNGAVGIAYPTQTLVASGGSQSYTWTVTIGTLPGGLTLNSSGTITGTPTQGGFFSFTVKATDTNGASGTAQLSLSIANAVSITTATLPNGTVNQSYGPVSLTATGGTGGFTWAATGLPPGISIGSSTGSIGGAPTSGGNFTVTVTVTDTITRQTATQSFNISVGYPALLITSGASPAAIALGGTVSATFSASGGESPYTWSATGLPGNVTLSSAGVLSGSPGQPGLFPAKVAVTDAQPSTVSTSIVINVFGLTSPTTLASGVSGQFYSASVAATGGTSPYSFSATGLPAGLSLSPAGNFTGTVTTGGTYSFTVKAADSGGLSLTANFMVTFAKPQAITISTSTLPSGTVNAPYTQTLSASGGFAPYTWAVSQGSTPAGLSLSSAGTLSGTPTTPGAYSFGVMATDGAGAIATATISLTVQPTPLTITTQSLPSGVSGLGYPQQVLGATGGVQPYTWAVTTGSLPTGMTLSTAGSLTGTPSVSGNFPVTVTVTDMAGTTGTANFGLTIRPPSADLVLSNSSLSFSLMTPATAVPPSQAVGVQSSQSSQQIGYTVSLNPAAPWLSLTNGSTTPDTIQTAINPSALTLTPGNYSTTLGVKCTTGSCAGNTQTVAVNLKVTSAPPQLRIGTDLLSYGTTDVTASPTTQSITIQNTGGGSLNLTSVSCEAAWCTVGATPGTLAGGVSASIPITVNPALLTGGFFRTQVDIMTSGGSGSVPVTVLVSQISTMTLAPVGTQFSMQSGGAPGNANGSFLVTVTSASAVNWNSSIVSTSPWLRLNSPTGTSSATSPGTVSFSIDPVNAAQLAPGVYYGQIQVSAPGIVNSPQNFEVVLSVSPVTTSVVPDPEPAGLLFITTVGGTAPPQTVTIYSGSAAAAGFQASATTNGGGVWLSVSPSIGSASTGSPGITSVTVNTAGLQQGVYTGGVSYSLSATAVRVVNVTLIVTPPGSASQVTSETVSRGVSPHAGACTPTVLVPTQTGLVNNFSAAVAWPTPLSVILANDCGSLINSGQLVATFSNGDPPLPLTLADPSKGLYSGTWTPRKAVAQMTVIAHASAAGYPDAVTQVVGAATPNAAPVLTPHGTLHSFNPLVGAALAPGTIIQIYGQNLASQTVQPTTIPLPTTINGTSVIVGGVPAPLYYVSSGQINAQLPFELTPGNQYQILISANGALTTPDSITLSAATPGLAAFGDSTLIAQHGDGSLVSATSPAKSSEYLVAYLAGMGGTNATPPSGTASPSSPLALPTAMPVLTINGTAYPIAFAGLTPGLVGLYQMNFQVPAGLPAGNITVGVSQNGQASNQTVLPYQP